MSDDKKRRPTCNVEEARHLLCAEKPPTRQHVYNLFRRRDLEGYFTGRRRGLRIYRDSVEALKARNDAAAAEEL